MREVPDESDFIDVTIYYCQQDGQVRAVNTSDTEAMAEPDMVQALADWSSLRQKHLYVVRDYFKARRGTTAIVYKDRPVVIQGDEKTVVDGLFGFDPPEPESRAKWFGRNIDESDQTPLTQIELGMYRGCGCAIALTLCAVLWIVVGLVLRWAGVL